MKNTSTSKWGKLFSIAFGILFAIGMAAPYIIFREEIHRYALMGYIGVAVACAISNASIFLPTSSTIIILAAASILNPLLCVILGSFGTALGEQSSYFCGMIGRIGFDDKSATERKTVEWLKANAFLTIFFFAFLPLPALFDVVGITSGALKIRWSKYAIAALLGKLSKFAIAVAVFYLIIPSVLHDMPDSIQSMGKSLLEQLGIVR